VDCQQYYHHYQVPTTTIAKHRLLFGALYERFTFDAKARRAMAVKEEESSL